jgi:hypothetical protein
MQYACSAAVMTLETSIVLTPSFLSSGTSRAHCWLSARPSAKLVDPGIKRALSWYVTPRTKKRWPLVR